MASDQRVKVQFYISPETREQDELIQEYLEDSKERPSSLAREAMLAACALKQIDPRLVSTIAAMYRRGTQGEFIAKLIGSFASWEMPVGNAPLKVDISPDEAPETTAPNVPSNETPEPKNSESAPVKTEIGNPVSAAVKKNFSPL